MILFYYPSLTIQVYPLYVKIKKILLKNLEYKNKLTENIFLNQKIKIAELIGKRPKILYKSDEIHSM